MPLPQGAVTLEPLFKAISQMITERERETIPVYPLSFSSSFSFSSWIGILSHSIAVFWFSVYQPKALFCGSYNYEGASLSLRGHLETDSGSPQPTQAPNPVLQMQASKEEFPDAFRAFRTKGKLSQENFMKCISSLGLRVFAQRILFPGVHATPCGFLTLIFPQNFSLNAESKRLWFLLKASLKTQCSESHII